MAELVDCPRCGPTWIGCRLCSRYGRVPVEDAAAYVLFKQGREGEENEGVDGDLVKFALSLNRRLTT